MTLRNNLKQISLCYFSALICDLFDDACFRWIVMNLQTEKIKAKISRKDLTSMYIKRQFLFPYGMMGEKK